MKSYIPEPLNPIVVKELFQTVLATKNSTQVTKCILFPKEKGAPQDSAPILFDVYELENQADSVEYLLGQLKAVHENKSTITIQEACVCYDGSVWFTEQSALLQFFASCMRCWVTVSGGF